jgi:hypothetical protein
MSMQIAAPDAPKIRPAFTVEKMEGKITREVINFDAKGKKVVTSVEADAGYFVKFPKGHSIRVLDDAELHRLGFDRTIPLINDDGEEVGHIPNHITKSKAA